MSKKPDPKARAPHVPAHQHEQEQTRRRELDAQRAEIERTRELLTRTVRFLTRCTEDPKAALATDDPRELIRGLEALGVAPPASAPEVRPTPVESEPEVEEAPRSIPMRRRRSA